MIPNSYWIDANILIRHLTNDHKILSPKAKLILQKIANNNCLAYLNTLVLHETIYVLEHAYNLPRKNIGKQISSLISINNLHITDIDKKNLKTSLKDYINLKIDFPDCVYKELCKKNKYKLLSFDNNLKKLKITPHDKVD